MFLWNLLFSLLTYFFHFYKVDRVASMLNYFLLQLVGPQRKSLSLKDPEKYEFRPKHLLKQVGITFKRSKGKDRRTQCFILHLYFLCYFVKLRVYFLCIPYYFASLLSFTMGSLLIWIHIAKVIVVFNLYSRKIICPMLTCYFVVALCANCSLLENSFQH
jgi:hypothetical protein